jgi:hypothetical protein
MSATDIRTRFQTAVRVGAVLVPPAVAAILAALGDAVTSETSVLVLALVVVGAGAFGDRVAGVLAAISSGLWFDFFLTAPTGQFTIEDPDDLEATLLLVVVGVAVTEVALWGLRQEARSARRAGYLDGVLESAAVAASGAVDHDDVVRQIAGQIKDVLGVERCRYVPMGLPHPGVAVLHRDGSLHRGGHVVAVDREGLPSDVEVCISVGGPADAQGHFRVTAASHTARPGVEQRRVAVLLAAQAATAAPHRPAD